MMTEDQVEAIYIGKQLSIREIEEQYGIPHTTFGRWLKKYTIPSRPRIHPFGFKHSEETKLKISIAKKGQTPWNKGIPCPQVLRERIRQKKLIFRESEEKLTTLYWDEHRTLAEIGALYGISTQTVLNRMKQLGIKRRTHSETMIGENHWNWKGTALSARGTWWRKIRQRVLKRDDYTCQSCGSLKDLVIHHLLPYRKYKNSDIDKLLTLCRSCHSNIENRKIGRYQIESTLNPPGN